MHSNRKKINMYCKQLLIFLLCSMVGIGNLSCVQVRAAQNTIKVSNEDALFDAINSAKPGDVILVADGNYSATKINGVEGTEEAPIIVQAENSLGAVINEGLLEFYKCSNITFKGFKFTTDSTIKLTGCNHIRLTENHFRLNENGESLKWIIIQGENSEYNKIDNNLFDEKSNPGNFITIDGTNKDDYGSCVSSQHDVIEYNKFLNCGPRVKNEMEAIRVGWSEMSQSSGYTIVQYNTFENCDGDPEIVSVKTCDDIIRYNTFKTCQGVLSLRHGDRSEVYGNVFLGEGKEGTGGIRIYGKDHKVHDNYMG